MSSRKLRKGDLAYVRDNASLQADMQVGAIIQVIGIDKDDPQLPIAAIWMFHHGQYNDYYHGGKYINGYWFHDRELELIELEAADVSQTDVPQPQGKLPDAGRGPAGDAPALPEHAQ